MEANTAATYALIYHFLKHQSQHKAAEAVKKAARSFVVLRDDLEQEGPPLEDIIKDWMEKKHTKADTDSSSEDSSSDENSTSSDSSSEDTSDSESEDDDTSESESSSSDSDESPEIKKPRKAAERDTSVTLSSAGENAREVAKKVVQVAEQDRSTKTKKKTSESESFDSDSSDLDSSSKSSASDSSNTESSTSSSDSSSTSSSSDEDKANVNEKAPEPCSDESDSKSQQKEDAPVAKKRKTSENGAAVTTAVAADPRHAARASQRKGGPPPMVRERFQRVRVQNLAPDVLLDNGYEARGGARNDYGERAHRDLMVTRGAGFRKEKNKKKRGSYRGGEITMENHSIKFDY